MELFIDTSHSSTCIVELRNKKQYSRKVSTGNYKSQIVLPAIEKILEDNAFSFSSIKKIRVFSGPGSFTGLRVGATVGRMLAFLLGIRINEKTPIEELFLTYKESKYELAE